MKKISSFFVLLFFSFLLNAQVKEDIIQQELSFQEFIGFVKKHHPLVKQANLNLQKGEANLLKSRGGFDPKVEVDYARKDFKNTTYYNELNAMFKIPTWYGVEFKAAFEDNDGTYLSPSLTTPNNGLYSAGVSISLLQGLLINERMASLKKAHFFNDQTQAERDVAINNILYEASLAYFSWLEAVNETRIFTNFLKNSEVRLKAVEKSVAVGDKPKIAIAEVRINLQNRQLGLEEAKLKSKQAALKLSNYLWINSFPVELKETTKPVIPNQNELENSLLIFNLGAMELLANQHPKLKSIAAKIDGLEVDVALKKNKLLPKLNLNYNFLSENVNAINNFDTANYKGFVNFSMPLFLRKERGDLRLSKLKLQEESFKMVAEKLSIKNKIEEAQITIASLIKQSDLIENMIVDYESLVKAEERKFFVGESSLFLINYREEKLIEAQLKGNSLSVKKLKSSAKLYNNLGISM